MIRDLLLRRGFVLPLVVTGIVPATLLLATSGLGSSTLWSVTLGVLVLLAGLALLLSTSRLFHAGGGSLAPWNPPQHMVVAGPYRYVRNPMIIGIFLMLVGEALIFLSPWLAGWFLVFFVAKQIYIRYDEEPALRRRFGQDYERYCAAVPRWLPRRPATSPLTERAPHSEG